jgi:hypothetical protein
MRKIQSLIRWLKNDTGFHLQEFTLKQKIETAFHLVNSIKIAEKWKLHVANDVGKVFGAEKILRWQQENRTETTEPGRSLLVRWKSSHEEFKPRHGGKIRAGSSGQLPLEDGPSGEKKMQQTGTESGSEGNKDWRENCSMSGKLNRVGSQRCWNQEWWAKTNQCRDQNYPREQSADPWAKLAHGRRQATQASGRSQRAEKPERWRERRPWLENQKAGCWTKDHALQRLICKKENQLGTETQTGEWILQRRREAERDTGPALGKINYRIKSSKHEQLLDPPQT